MQHIYTLSANALKTLKESNTLTSSPVQIAYSSNTYQLSLRLGSMHAQPFKGYITQQSQATISPAPQQG
jgi:hypothetical protein